MWVGVTVFQYSSSDAQRVGGAGATVLLEDPTCVSAQAEDVLIDLSPARAVWRRMRQDGRAKRGGATGKPVWLLSGLSFPCTEGITQVPLSCRLQAAAPPKRAGLRLKNPNSKGVKFWRWELRGGVARKGSSHRAVGKQPPEELERMPHEEARLLDVSSAFTRNRVKASRGPQDSWLHEMPPPSSIPSSCLSTTEKLV